MKTKLLFMLLLCSLYCVSCSDDVKTDVKEKTEVEVNYVKLNEALNLYSQDFAATHATSTSTRGFWKWFRTVLACDATGALLGSSLGGGGALIGGAIFSALGASCAYVVPRPELPNEVAFVRDIPCLMEQEDSIGFSHNAILLEIAEENEGIFDQNLTAEEWTNLIVPKAEKYGYSLSASDEDAIMNNVKTMPLTSELMQSDEQLISYYKAKAPEYAQQLDVIHSYVSTASLITNEDDLKEYTQGCVQIISDAQLPLTERKALVSSVVVAESSAILWIEPEEVVSLKP